MSLAMFILGVIVLVVFVALWVSGDGMD